MRIKEGKEGALVAVISLGGEGRKAGEEEERRLTEL